MPPTRQSPPPPGTPRRRTGPGMPSGWVWLVILAMILGMLWVTYVFQNESTIDYSNVKTLVDKGLVSKITVEGTDHLTGELKPEAANDPTVKELKIRGSRFTAPLPPDAA